MRDSCGNKRVKAGAKGEEALEPSVKNLAETSEITEPIYKWHYRWEILKINAGY